MKKLTLIAMLLMSGLVGGRAQEDAAMQSIFSYVQNVIQFSKSCPQEKVYLHFDNTAYFQGDVIWFSAYVVDAATQAPAPSKVLYVELLSPNGVVLRQVKLKVENGQAHGSLPLVDTPTDEARALRGTLALPSGFYEVRAYTRTMLNFDEAGIFSRVFPVYESPAKEGDYSNPTMSRYNNPYDMQRPEQEKAKKLTVTFYPEGGALVLGVPNRVAFKAMDENGMGVELSGVLKSSEEAMPVALKSMHDGMGWFDFTPEKKRNEAEFEYDGKKHTFRLPDAEGEGYAMMVNNLSPEQMKVQLRGVNMPDELLGVMLMTRGRVCYIDTLTARQGQVLFSVSKENLPTGVHQLTVFNAKGEVRGQRLVFINNGIVAGNVHIEAPTTQAAPFAQVQMQVKTFAPTGAPQPATISVAVRDNKNLGTAYCDNVLTNMLLSSELKGYIHNPEYYFEATDAAHTQALNLLMMVQGWTRYNWRQMARVEPYYIKHYVEDGLVIDGMVLQRLRDKPISDISVKMKLYSPDRAQSQETTVLTDNEGRFGFSVEEFMGEWDMFLTATKEEGKELDCRMRLDRGSRPAPRVYMLSDTYLPDFATLKGELPSEEVKKDPMMQAAPDSVFVLDNVDVYGRKKYIDYLTFKAFNAEEDTELHLDQGAYTYTVRDYLKDKGYDVDLSRYDGVVPNEITTRDEMVSWELEQCPINSRRVLWYLHNEGESWHKSSYIPGFDLDMQDVKSILVYDSPLDYMQLPYVRSILSVSIMEELEKNKKVDDMVFSRGLYVVDIAMYPKGLRKSKVKGQRQTKFRGYTEVAEFYAPEYPDGPIKGDVDYRRTLYWNPALTTDAQGEATVTFYNNGYSKHFDISAEGITPQGTVMRYAK